jgi:hypothetical protein
MQRSLFLSGILLALQPCFALAAGIASKDVFEHLKTLTGDWRSTKSGSATIVNYHTIANGSSVVETWTMSPTRQSMTVYTMDGDRLLATHYCPQGNAPRLRLTHSDASVAHHFTFLDGANLQDRSGSHQHAFWVRFDAAGTVTRNETYIRNAAAYDAERDKGSEESFARVHQGASLTVGAGT